MNPPAAAKFILAGLLVGGALPGADARAAEPAARAARPAPNPRQVSAATRDAVDNLLDDIGRTPLARGLTVRDFLRATGGFDEVTKELQTAEQVGSARWPDDQTCQVELQISGARVAHQLAMIARARPKDLPVSAAELEKPLAQMRARSFSATGTAVARGPGGAAASPAYPNPAPQTGGATGSVPRVAVPGPASVPTGVAKPLIIQSERWARIADAEREMAVVRAKLDAAQRSLRSVGPVVLSARATVGDVLAADEVGPAMEQWFVAQPVTRLEYRDDLRAEVVLEAGPAAAFDRFRALSQKQTGIALPAETDEAGWGRVRDGFRERMTAPVGRAAVELDPLGFAPRRAMGVPPDRGGRRPADAPAWAGRRLEADGIGARQRGRLMTARAAEVGAEAKLRAQVEALELRPGVLIGEAARQSKRIDAAVTRALRAARIGNTEYREDGSAKVDLYLDLDALWAELKDVE